MIHDKSLLYLSMSGVGIAWASTLSMPYAILSASLGFGWSMNLCSAIIARLPGSGAGFSSSWRRSWFRVFAIQRLGRQWRNERRWRLQKLRVELQLQFT